MFRAKLLILLALLWTIASARTISAQQPDPQSAAWFELHIRPVLATKCLKCHGPRKQESNLRLDSLEAILQGGDNGPAIVRGQPRQSLLIEALRYESLEMPPTGQLPEQVVRQFELWIAHNAPWPRQLDLLRESQQAALGGDQPWWAFQPLQKPLVPTIDGDHWSQNEIDRFVSSQLAQRQMQPAPVADKVTLVRRLYHDLIGLPPSPEQIDAYVNDPSPHAWEQLIDRLLADPRHGEHWGRFWLDVVRYAESDGWNQDAYRSSIWRYRDYVVRSFNEDRPFPQFVRQQLAGDEMPGDDPENLAATGFLRLGIYEYNQRDARSHWNDIVNEITDVTGDVFFGMGMACARCHDHKFDPLLQEDYFRLRAFFEPLVWRDDVRYATQTQLAQYQQQVAQWQEASAEVQRRIDELLAPYHDRKWRTTVDKFPTDIQDCFQKPVEQRTSWEHQMAYLIERQFMEEDGGPLKNISKQDKQQHEALLKDLAEFDSARPEPLPELMTVSDFSGSISPTVIPDDPEQSAIEPGIPTVLTSTWPLPEPFAAPDSRSSGRRTALARWIGRADNPLTTRVIVNRIWQQHFGRGIVTTPNDFGHLGSVPTHPELLDWLTSTFVEEGWSFKRLHKRILMSATWRQSAHHPRAAQYQLQDPSDDLYWRWPIRRLTAEQIRDAMLAATGELNRDLGGPSVEGDTARRSLYIKRLRNTPDEFLHAFDVADGLKSVALRNTTTTPTQSLLMINGDYALARATALSQRLAKTDFATVDQMLIWAFRSTWGRSPSEKERDQSLRFLGGSPAAGPSSIDTEKLIDFCHVLFNSSEFLYVD